MYTQFLYIQKSFILWSYVHKANMELLKSELLITDRDDGFISIKK